MTLSIEEKDAALEAAELALAEFVESYADGKNKVAAITAALSTIFIRVLEQLPPDGRLLALRIHRSELARTFALDELTH